MRYFNPTIGVLALLVVLTGCQTIGDVGERPKTHPLEDLKVTELAGEAPADTLAQPFIDASLEALEEGDFVAASEGFNRALKFDPTNAQLHFLNGLTYHFRARAGDSSQLEFAEVGYRLALQFDAGSFWSAYLLGHINYERQNYRRAQDAFAYALLFDRENVTILKALASASYYAQDLETATTAIVKAARLAPGDPDVVRNRAMIEAAAGRPAEARKQFAVFREISGERDNDFRTEFVSRRINDWREFHDRGGYQLVQDSTRDIFGSEDTREGLAPDRRTTSDSDDTKKSDDAKGPLPTRMALVDVVIIRSEEREATAKGVNLLSGLGITLGGTLFEFTDDKTIDKRGDGASTHTQRFEYNPIVSIQSVNYTLNIFNDNNDRNEVLARPTLVGLDGKKSEFFSGAIFHVELTGAAGSEGAVQDIPVGIKLDVTPKFVNDDTVELEVEAARAFIESRSGQAGFNNFAQTTKTVVTANVTMRFGETLVLSGLSEKETENLRDGVPFLQNIPGIQYLFSRETTLDFTKSVLILLTPRKPRYTFQDGTDRVDPENPADADEDQPNLDELKGRPDWFKPAPNLDAVFEHLGNRQLFKEFRTGDVTLETWDNDPALLRMFKSALTFLYF